MAGPVGRSCWFTGSPRALCRGIRSGSGWLLAESLAAYDCRSVPYLALFGIDPGPDYADWIAQYITGARAEL